MSLHKNIVRKNVFIGTAFLEIIYALFCGKKFSLTILKIVEIRIFQNFHN